MHRGGRFETGPYPFLSLWSSAIAMLLADTPPSNTVVLNAWVPATWPEFLAVSEDPAYEKATSYYFNYHMRIETMGVGPDHAIDNSLIHVAIVLYCALKGIPLRSLINASYRRADNQEAQPDSSYYVNDQVQRVSEGNAIVDLEKFPAPDLAIEIATTSLNDDLGFKRLLYEELGIREYWVVDVNKARILAFEMRDRGSYRITTSQVFPGLELAVLERVLGDRATQDDSQIMATLMTEFSTMD
jgi:Uma2 family endonuclease